MVFLGARAQFCENVGVFTPPRRFMHISGQCHCGAISFTALIDPSKVIACHCADCQAFSGAPFRAVLPVSAQNVSLTGAPRHYVKVADSGNRRAQAFCPECGTQLYACDPESPTVLNLRLGCVNERAQLPPVVHIWGQSAMPWALPPFGVPFHTQGMNSPLIAAV
jgi:hypothetical protein